METVIPVIICIYVWMSVRVYVYVCEYVKNLTLL